MSMSATSPPVESKQERERSFHNAAFSDRRRSEGVVHAYSILHDSRTFYEGFIRDHAKGARLLELGCGATAMGSSFGDTAGSIVGIDISDVAVEQAARIAARSGLKATYRVMDAESLQFPDRSFDLICSAAILHHLDLDRAYSEIARTLSPGGHAIFMEPLGHNPVINLYRRMTPDMRTPDEHPLLVSDLELARTYFGEVDVRYFILTTLLAIPLRRSRVFMPTLRALEAFDRFLFASAPWLKKYAWQVVIVLSEPRVRRHRS